MTRKTAEQQEGSFDMSVHRLRLATVVLALLLMGCESARLLNANQQFTSLMQQEAQAKQLLNDQTLDETAYDSALEGLRVEFAENGDVAATAARSATTDQSKASLFNVAARSYLKSGALADSKIPAIADEGLDACSRMSGLETLPTTCGYFFVVVPQAVSNDWTRQVDAVKRRANALPNDGTLSVEDGKLLVRAAEGLFGQLDALSSAEQKIDRNAGENLTKSIHIQEDKIFCNARSALISLRLVVETGEGWNRTNEEARVRVTERAHREALQQRPGGFSDEACVDQ